jgi:hypothetical protein
MNIFKQPDWDYIKEKYPNEYEHLRRYFGGCGHWSIVDCKEVNYERQLKVVESQKWFRLPMAGGFTVLNSSDLSVGDVFGPVAYIVTLIPTYSCDEDKVVFRITDTPVDIHKSADEVRALARRLREIIKKEDNFGVCSKLY